MAGRSLFILLLGFILHFAFVKTETCDEQVYSPPADDDRVTLTYDKDVDITTITLKEGYENVTVALYNCENPGGLKLGEFVQGSNDNLGLIIADDGSLVVTMKQDFENPSNQAYTFKVRLPTNVLKTVQFYVVNLDDSTPTIAPFSSSSCLVNEGLAIGEPTECYLIVTDADRMGIPDEMTFQVNDSGEVSDTFTLQKSDTTHCDDDDTSYCMTVDLYLQKTLSYYDRPVYSLKLDVKDPAGHQQTLAIVVQVNPENLMSPDITPKFANVPIEENYSGFLDIPNLMVIDTDSLDFGRFAITLESKNDCVRAFSVIPNVGYRNTSLKISVINPKILDFENVTCRKIVSTLTATEVANGSHIGTSTITIFLKNLNDETPEFTPSSYEFEVKEHEEMDHVIGSVNATDADPGDIVTYDLTGSTQLKINSDGEILVNDTGIDYERLKKIFLTVTATDTADHTAYATVIVTVTDINDEPPEISMPSAQPEVLENTTVGTVMDNIIITATDPDGNPDLSFDIDWTQSRAVKNGVIKNIDLFKDCFSCTTTKGENKQWKLSLRLEKKLNWGSYDTLYLYITVEDKHTVVPDFQNYSTASATLTMKIIDVNDNPPVFPLDIAPLSFKEGTEEDQILGSVVATDADGPDYNNISYSLVIQDIDEKYVKILPTGEIRTGADPVDYETVQTFTCTVTASDGKYEVPVDIIVNVEDVNDNTPNITDGFQEPIYVEENTNIFTDLRHIIAIDLDLSSKYNTLRYELDEGSYFEINQTGGVYVPDGIGDKLDYEKTNSYTVRVTVSDRCDDRCYSDSRSDMETLYFYLVDVNDNAPEFTDIEDPFARVTENILKGESVGVVKATDKDTNEMGRITFNITNVSSEQNKNEDIFNISTNGDKTATIFAKEDFTTAWGTYTVTVIASDCAEPFHTTPVDLKIVVVDINNHVPEFEFPGDGIKIRLDKSVSGSGPLVDWHTKKPIQIKAVDNQDAGEFGTNGIVYSVTGDNTAMEYLKIDSNGNLLLRKEFEDDTTNNFTLTYEACDANGDENLKNCSTQSAEVILKITQQYEPTFDTNVFETNFTENVTGMSEERTITIEVTDLNNEEECDVDCLKDPIYYFIIQNSEDKFFLFNKSSTLKLYSILDREEKENHTIVICVTNNENGCGEPDEKSKLQITVNVIDVIDTAPVFTMEMFTVGINIGDPAGNIVAQFIAKDADEYDPRHYSIDESSATVSDPSIEKFKNSFSLDEVTGELKLGFSPQQTMTGIFNFDVHAEDTGGFSAVTKAQVYIITDTNIMTIIFKNSYDYTSQKKPEIEEILTDVLKSQGKVKKFSMSNDKNGSVLADKTDASIFFLDPSTLQPIDKNVIKNQLNNGETYKALTDALLYQQNLVLDDVDQSTNPTLASDDGIPQIVLIVVSAVLGTLVLVLFAAFFLRTRSLNRRLEALSTTKFGSQDSGLNRVGVAVPNTNRHAVEGSNPVWGNEEVGSRDFDNMSDTSGDSDLIGIEENPEFSPFSKSGISNSGFTPDFEGGRRVSVNPMVAAGFDRGTGFNPLSAGDTDDFDDEINKRRESVNPLAVSHSNFKNDRPSETMGDDNFSFVPRPPITDL